MDKCTSKFHAYNRIYIPPVVQLMRFHEMKRSIYHYDWVVVMTYRTQTPSISVR